MGPTLKRANRQSRRNWEKGIMGLRTLFQPPEQPLDYSGDIIFLQQEHKEL